MHIYLVIQAILDQKNSGLDLLGFASGQYFASFFST